MENTYTDLRDCYKNWNDVDSESEETYRAKILQLAQCIVNDFGDVAEEN
jgi:hypothetical protein